MVVGCSFRARAAMEVNNLDIKAKKFVGDSMVTRELKWDAGAGFSRECGSSEHL